jgi:hypothetical protein
MDFGQNRLDLRTMPNRPISSIVLNETMERPSRSLSERLLIPLVWMAQ